LEGLGLVKKSKGSSGPIHFFPEDPSRLLEIADNNVESASKAKAELETLVESLSQEYSVIEGVSGVRVMRGIDGMRRVYDDVASTPGKSQMHILAGKVLMPNYLENILPLIRNMARRNASRGTKATALIPKGRKANKVIDEETDLEQVFLKEGDYTSPVEIRLYGDKVAFIVLGSKPETIVIKNNKVVESMRELFSIILKERKNN